MDGERRERVRLSIRGVQRIDGQEDCVETHCDAEYMRRDGAFYLSYEEDGDREREGRTGSVSPDTSGGERLPVKCLLKWQEGKLERIRGSVPRLRMIFEEGAFHETDYPTPFGMLKIGIRTERVALRETEEGFCVEIRYRLERAGETISDCRTEIAVQRA